ncbi:hypothetical protein GRI62_00865 [Erythrobacter arachoides]|uniref:Uncharacterized protein n=1 Tax=Aurantiacibacter arachoides TaxID=1850444 RepID=A0A844ZYZ5_9SPHN|nr:hypothetical protein [Aurantiacibacter arachoides]MXO92156.1 hypothetical protein [Aurantiacibacter arachoides]GGD59262.1 hypothetical protein GCM10011411_19340 [Aurantiacibacter arachoides]
MARKPPLIEIRFPISRRQFEKIDKAVRKAGYAAAIERSENILPPRNANAFAAEAIYVICNSGMSNIVAVPIFARCMVALQNGESVRTVFGHPGKAAAIDDIWRRRASLFRQLKKADNLIGFCATLPWTGNITKYHLAKNLGEDVAKPDVHLNRLANPEGVTAQEMCERLARETGYRVATVDLILWRACAEGIVHSR